MAKMLQNGILRDKPAQTDGRFRRVAGGFHGRIEADPAAHFPAEPDRYHLYLSRACPWCHGVNLMRVLKGLEDTISVTEMDPVATEDGWAIDQAAFDETAGVPRDRYLYQVYLRVALAYTGPVTVPVLLDKTTGEIVSTESADIMRMLNSAFDHLGATRADFYPEQSRGEIDGLNQRIQEPIRNGVYRAGFATSQEAYDEAVTHLFVALDEIEALLGERRYLTGSGITDSDLRLFPTLVRFDQVYVTHFRIDRRRIADYTNLSRYLRDLYHVPGVAGTVDIEHIRTHYFRSHRHLNPSGIIPIGPDINLDACHGGDDVELPVMEEV